MNLKRLTIISLLVSVGLILSFVEILLNFTIPIPGAKLGLTNVVSVFSLFRLGILDTFIIVILRIFLVGFLFGNLSSIIYSVFGAVFSLIVMILAKNFGLHVITTSILGGVAHNLGQLCCAVLVTNTTSLFMAYGPYLFLIGMLTGLLVGIAAQALITAFRNYEL